MVGDPIVRHSLAKFVVKGEDAWAQHPSAQWASGGVAVPFSFFGVFDGHGGRAAAAFAAKHLLPHVLAATNASAAANGADSKRRDVGNAEFVPPSADGTSTAVDSAGSGMDACSREWSSCVQDELGSGLPGPGVAAEQLQGWRRQDELIGTLPGALAAGFEGVQEDFFMQAKESGTTATAAAVVGWEVLVANVGDSTAYLDTGAAVVQVSGNHRLDSSRAEVERCEAQGCEVVSSAVEGRPVGPLRVWPGGLAMSRTIGDAHAGPVVLATPEVRQVTLPQTGGRLILASDGLWDAVVPKTAAAHVRGLPASKAARELVQAAKRVRGQRDDITVLVVDVLPAASDRLPPLLAARSGRGGGLSGADTRAAAVTVRWPLVDATSGIERRLHALWERRLAFVSSEAQQQGWPCHHVATLQQEGSQESSSWSSSGPTTPLAASACSTALRSSSEGEEEDETSQAQELALDGVADGDATVGNGWEVVAAKPAKAAATSDLRTHQRRPNNPHRQQRQRQQGTGSTLSRQQDPVHNDPQQRGRGRGRRGGGGRGGIVLGRGYCQEPNQNHPSRMATGGAAAGVHQQGHKPEPHAVTAS